MKRSLLLLALGTSLLAWPLQAQGTDSTPPAAPADSTTPPPPGEQGFHHGGGKDFAKLRQVREEALKANPDLAAEGKALFEKMAAYRKKLDAAMVAIDPSVGPLLKEGDHHRFGGGDGPPPSP